MRLILAYIVSISAAYGQIMASATTQVNKHTRELAIVNELKTFANKMIYVDYNNVYTDATRTTLAKDGEQYNALNITELISGDNITWSDGGNQRRSFLDIFYGFTGDRIDPMFKNPFGDTPHVTLTNVLGTQFISPSFSSLTSPNTVVTLVRQRLAASDEGAFGMSVAARDRGYNHLEINNFAGGVELDNDTGVPAFEKWNLLLIEDNGTSSGAEINGIRLGTNKTLPASFVNQLYYGTNSHVVEHDVKFCLLYNGIFNNAQKARILSLANQLVPINSMPYAPCIYNPVVTFDGVDSFYISSYSFNSVFGVAIDPASIQISWCVIGGTTVQGWTGLDTQRIVHVGSTLVRSLYPSAFPVPGSGQQQVFAIITARDLNGFVWTGIPFRSRAVNDNVTGTPAGTYPPVLQSIIVTSADQKKLVLTYTGGANLDNTSGNVSYFTVLVNGVEVPKSSIAFPGGRVLNLNLVNNIQSGDEVTVKLVQGVTPLKDTNNKSVENFVSGILVEVDNQI